MYGPTPPVALAVHVADPPTFTDDVFAEQVTPRLAGGGVTLPIVYVFGELVNMGLFEFGVKSIPYT